MTTKSQTDNTEWLDSILEILHNSWLEDDYEYDDPDGLHAKEQILAKLKQQDIKSRIDELEKWLALVTWPNNYLAMREEMQKHIDELSAKLRSKA